MNNMVNSTNIKKLHMDSKLRTKRKSQINHDNNLNIGARLKKLRLGNKLTLQIVAKETGFSPSLISQIENNNISPPIATLSRIARYFDVKIGMFFAEEQEECLYEVVHANERKAVTRIFTSNGITDGYSSKSLSFRMHHKKMEPFLLTITAKALGEKTFSHEGEEFIFIIKGNAELILDNQLIPLSQGDSIYFDSSLKHRLDSTEASGVEVLTIIAR